MIVKKNTIKGVYMDYQNIILSIEDHIATITLNRPKAWNALCDEINYEIIDALNKIKYDQDVRVLIITGGEKVFAAGADIKQMSHATVMVAQRTADLGQSINNMLEELTIPVIAAVNGMALGGGCEMTLACDFRIVGENTTFAFPEVSLGILPGAGGTQRMTRLIGATKTKEMILLGKKVKGKEALEIGLATELVEDSEIMNTAIKMAKKLMTMPAYALAQAKRAINLGEVYGIGTGKLFERELFSLCFANPDQAEGMDAFASKRAPEYKNIR